MKENHQDILSLRSLGWKLWWKVQLNKQADCLKLKFRCFRIALEGETHITREVKRYSVLQLKWTDYRSKPNRHTDNNIFK